VVSAAALALVAIPAALTVAGAFTPTNGNDPLALPGQPQPLTPSNHPEPTVVAV